MRLVYYHMLELEEITYKDMSNRYAISSYTWAADEVTFQEYSSGTKKVQHKQDYHKVVRTCSQARKDGIDCAWIDTW